MSSQGETMNTLVLPKLGAACGAAFAVALFASSGNSGHVNVVEIAALALFLPFLTYLCGILREAEGPGGWLAQSAFAAGIAGIAIKIASGVPEVALRHVDSGTPLHKALDDMATGATLFSLYPLALMLAAVAALTLRTRVLPRWLGVGAGLAAVVLAVNGSIMGANGGPALVLFLLWTLAASVTLFRRATTQPTGITQPTPAASI
jgi:hypothetical protein